MIVGEIEPSVLSAFGAMDASTITIFILYLYHDMGWVLTNGEGVARISVFGM